MACVLLYKVGEETRPQQPYVAAAATAADLRPMADDGAWESRRKPYVRLCFLCSGRHSRVTQVEEGTRKASAGASDDHLLFCTHSTLFMEEKSRHLLTFSLLQQLLSRAFALESWPRDSKPRPFSAPSPAAAVCTKSERRARTSEKGVPT